MALPVITVEQMRAWEEASWKAGKVEREVIETVGKLVAERALAATRDQDRILVLAGKGHNGDDARAAVPHLLNRKVRLIDVTDPAAAVEEISRVLGKQPRLVIDGIFGIGLNRPLAPEWIKLFETINASHAQVLSIDVPSGFNVATGQAEGGAIEAAVTLTVGAVKRGLLAESAWKYVGRLEVAPEIGLAPSPYSAAETELQWPVKDDFQLFSWRRPVSSHKGDYGHLAILGGSLGYHGAAVLAAHGARGAHPGLISVFTQAEAYLPIASQLQSVMAHPWPALVRIDEICSALVVGPGLASSSLPQDFKNTVQRYWRMLRQPMIVDASALDWLEPSKPIAPELTRVVTPHPGEAARLLGTTAREVQSDRVGAVRKISERFGNCWVVLKGHQTLVGRAQGPISVNPTGNPLLAQGGSGDVLAGFIGGLIAQPRLQKDPGLTLRFAAWAHGAAADRLSAARGRWTIEELSGEVSIVGPNS
jgi:hydroxyethylthiazole kinase-like uncharacterized protein yjeF